MKKIFRLFSVLIATVLLCMVFCSCDTLDEMRKNQAKFIDDSTIEFRGKIYKQLPDCDDIVIQSGNIATLTKSDVPVLLSNSFGQHITIDSDMTLLRNENKTYCRKDMYDETVEKVNNHKLDRLCIYTLTEKNNDSSMLEYKYVILGSDIAEIVERTLAGEQVNMPEPTGKSYYAYCQIYRCDETLMFVNRNIPIHLEQINNNLYMSYNDIDGKSHCFAVANEDNSPLFPLFA